MSSFAGSSTPSSAAASTSRGVTTTEATAGVTVISNTSVSACCCEQLLCQESPKFRCMKCKELSIPEPIGHYCSRQCQERSWESKHKLLHKLMKSKLNYRTNNGVMELVVMVLYQLLLMKKLPTDSIADPSNPTAPPIKTFSIALLGAKNFYEGQIPFDSLFDWLTKLLFPQLEKLTIYLIGPDLDLGMDPSTAGRQPNQMKPMLKRTNELFDGKVTVVAIADKAEKHLTRDMFYKPLLPSSSTATTADSSSCYLNGIATILQPGLAQLTHLWKPVMLLLRDWQIPTIISSYTHKDYRSDDCFYDESIMIDYFATKIIIPYQINPLRCVDESHIAKAGYYLVFQGEEHERDYPTWTEKELLRFCKVAFLKSLIFTFQHYEPSPSSALTCQHYLEDFEKGLITIPESMTLKTLEFEALAYRRKK